MFLSNATYLIETYSCFQCKTCAPGYIVIVKKWLSKIAFAPLTVKDCKSGLLFTCSGCLQELNIGEGDKA